MEEISRFSTSPRLLFSQRTAFRTRTRNAFSLSHLAGFVRAKRKFPGGQAERPRAQSQTSKAAQGALRDVLRTPVHSRPGGRLQLAKDAKHPKLRARILHARFYTAGHGGDEPLVPIPPLCTTAGARGVHEHVRKLARHMLRTPLAK